MVKVIFCWCGFPQYAARQVGAFVRSHPEYDVRVVATRPGVPIEGMERLCECPVEWLDSPAHRSSALDDVDSHTYAFITGWFTPSFNEIRKVVRKSGGRVFCFIDNNHLKSESLGFKARLVNLLKNLRFRLRLRWLYDGFIVPGESGRKLLAEWGVGDALVSSGMYSADAAIFHDGKPLHERSKRIIYVGQFCERKNVQRLVAAFKSIDETIRGGWELHMYGCGPVEIENGSGVCVHPFAQPEVLAEEYRKARIFCLPSVEEHWGLVVHEGALSGCVLALSDCIGAADDFANRDNGVLFDPHAVDDIKKKLELAMSMDENRLSKAHDESIRAAQLIGLETFVRGIEERMK